MDVVVLVIVFAFVVSVLSLVGFVLFKLSPLAHHADHYRDPKTGERRFESPRLD